MKKIFMPVVYGSVHGGHKNRAAVENENTAPSQIIIKQRCCYLSGREKSPAFDGFSHAHG